MYRFAGRDNAVVVKHLAMKGTKLYALVVFTERYATGIGVVPVTVLLTGNANVRWAK